MDRSDNLFAAFSALLLLGGIALTQIAPRQGISFWQNVRGSQTSLSTSPHVLCFGTAAVFALFAFLYSTGYVHIERAFVQWQLWLSAGSIFLFLVGYFSFGVVIHPPTFASNLGNTDLISGLIILSSIPMFLVAQALFVLGVIRGFLHVNGS